VSGLPRGNSSARGAWAEDLACRHLLDQGLVLLRRNYRCRRGEIDLVMRDGATIAFVEVRMRSRDDFGNGAQSVDQRKQSRVRSTAEHYLLRHANPLSACRFDVVSIGRAGDAHTLTWIRDAFRA
jgi:putative endonuclease